MQQAMYEGISMLCFCCGRLGHKQETCCFHVKQVVKKGEEQLSQKTNETRKEVQSDPNYGP